MSRLEGIAECLHSPDRTIIIDVQVVLVTQIMDTTEKVRLTGHPCSLGILLPFCWSNMYTYFNAKCLITLLSNV